MIYLLYEKKHSGKKCVANLSTIWNDLEYIVVWKEWNHNIDNKYPITRKILNNIYIKPKK